MSARFRVHGVVPPTGRYVREDRCQAPVDKLRTLALRPPIDLMYAAAAFEAAGCECRIDDCPAAGGDWPELAASLRSFSPDTVLLSTTTPTLRADLAVARRIRALLPDARILAKGAHVSVHDGDALARCPELDGVLRGEIEDTCLELGEGKPLEGIAGLSFRDPAGRVRRNPDRAYARDLDAFPHPARHLVRNELYRRPDTGAPQTTVVTNRGCPHRCIYCLARATAGAKNRYRSPADVLVELRSCVRDHRIRSFLFRSELFTQDRRWVIELCRSILTEGLEIEWACNSRVDSVDPELLGWMRRAGCWIVAFGVESGDQETLDRLRKRARAEAALEAVRLCRRAGIRSSVYLMMGLPWETRASARALSEFARRLDPDVLEVFFAYPFPGTELHAQLVAAGLLAEGEFPERAYDAPALPGLHLSVSDLAALRRRVLRDFYLRPRKLLATLRWARSPGELGNILRAGLDQLRLITVGR